MKQNSIILFIAILLFYSNISIAQVAVNRSGSNPDVSAILDVSSTERGMLIPRMQISERDAIDTPATGLMIFATDDNRFYVYNGSSWESILSGNDGGWIVSGNDLISGVTGLVGIGTSSPAGHLEVANYGSYLYESTEVRVSLYSDGANARPGLSFRRSHSPVLGDGTSANAVTQDGDVLGRVSFNGIRVNGSGGSSSGTGWFEMIQKGSESSGVPGQFQITTSNGLGNRATRFVIDPNGNVGIGTTNPGAMLDVNGNLFLSTSSSQIDFINNSGSTDRMIIRKNPGSFGEINIISNHDLKFRTNDTDRLIIEDNGDIDVNNNQIKNFRIENRTSDPTTPTVGQMWIRTDL